MPDFPAVERLKGRFPFSHALFQILPQRWKPGGLDSVPNRQRLAAGS
jgi:hypothetical protein